MTNGLIIYYITVCWIPWRQIIGWSATYMAFVLFRDEHMAHGPYKKKNIIESKTQSHETFQEILCMRRETTNNIWFLDILSPLLCSGIHHSLLTQYRYRNMTLPLANSHSFRKHFPCSQSHVTLSLCQSFISTVFFLFHHTSSEMYDEIDMKRSNEQ